MQQVVFAGNLNSKDNQGRDINNNTTMFFITEGAEETVLDFSQGIVKVL